MNKTELVEKELLKCRINKKTQADDAVNAFVETIKDVLKMEIKLH